MKTNRRRIPEHFQATLFSVLLASLSVGAHAASEPSGTQINATHPGAARTGQPEVSRRENTTQRGKVILEMPAQESTTETEPLSNPTGEAQMIYIDPVTGEFTSSPTLEEQRFPRLLPDESVDTSFEELEVITHPDGSMSVDLQGRFQSRLHATIDDAGKVSVHHQEDVQPPSDSAQTIPIPTEKQ